MTDVSKEQAEVQKIEPIKATLGVPFLLFPPKRPFPYVDRRIYSHDKIEDNLEQRINVDGFGEVRIWLQKDAFDKDALDANAGHGERVVLFTQYGPVELAKEGVDTQAIADGDYLYILGVNVQSPDVDFRLNLPRSEIVYNQDDFWQADEEYINSTPKDDKGPIAVPLLSSNPDFLHSIKAEIK